MGHYRKFRPIPADPGDCRPPGPRHSVAESAKAGFIIRVAGIDATAVTEGDTAFTVATTDKPLVYIAGVAATVEGTAGAWTVTKPEITADTCVSVVKDQAIAAPAQKWYESPKRVGIMWYDQEKHTGYGSNDYTGLASSFDGLYVGLAYGSNNTESYLGNVANIIDGDTTNIYAYQDNNRGNCVSKEWGVMLVGTAGSENKLRAWNLNENSKIATVTLKADGYDSFSGDSIAIIGNKLWVNGYAGANNKAIYRFTIPASGFVDGLELTAEAVVTAAEQIRNFRVYEVGGKFIVYAKADAAFYVGTMEDGLVKKDDFNTNDKGRYCDVAVAGSHLYIFNAYTADVEMYDIDTTTGWFASEAVPTKISMLEVCGQPSWTSNDAGRGSSIFVTPDETTLVHCGYYGVSAVQYLPPPTFSIQLVKATETHEGNVYTFTPAEGCVMSSVFANGAAVADAELVKNEDGTWTWTPTAETGDFDVVAAAKAAIPAVGHKWYEGPRMVGKSAARNYSEGGGSMNSTLDEGYFADFVGFTGGFVRLFEVSDLVDGGNTDVDPVWIVGNGEIPGGSLRGGAICTKLNIVMTGNNALTQDGDNDVFGIVYPINPSPVGSGEGRNVKLLNVDTGLSFDSGVFSDDAKYFFANARYPKNLDDVTGTRNYVWKYEVVNGLQGENGGLKYVAKYEIGDEVSHIRYAKIGDVEYLYVGCEHGLRVLNTATGVASKVNEHNYDSVRSADVAVVGNHVYVGTWTDSKKDIACYNLDTATGWITGDPIATFDAGDYGANSMFGINFAVTPDEETLIIAGQAKANDHDHVVYAFQYCPQYEVKFVVDDVEIATNKVWAGETTAALDPAPTKEGFKFVNWTNETYVTGFDFTTAITTDLMLYANFEKDAQPVNPEEPKQYDDAEKAKAAADAINAAKETMIITPEGATPSAYTALFTAVVTADNKVVVELNEDGTNTLQQSANDLAEAVAGLGDSTAASVTVTVTDAMIEADAIVPGFYYGLGASTTVDGEKVVGEGQWKQATTEGIDGGLTAAKPSADKGFFQVKVSVKNPAE